MPSNSYGCVRHETCGSEVKTMPHGNCSGDVDDFQRQSRFAQKGHDWWRIMEVWLWRWNQIQSSQWKRPDEPGPKKTHQVRSDVNVFVTVFFDCNGVVHPEFMPHCRTVNKIYYLGVMRRLRQAIHQNRTEFSKNQSWILHYDNAAAYTSMFVREFLTKNKTVIMP